MGRETSRKPRPAEFIKTFTYYIPEPPQRKRGYREKEFDKIMQGILSSGFQILDLKTTSASQGIFVMVLLKAKTKKIFDLDLDLDLQDKFQLSNTHTSDDIILDIDDE